jgi:O-antigen/teichoic acid export membrane protein
MDSISSKIKDISSIGFADILSKAIASIFWFYIASLLEPSSYGEITYVFSIAGVTSAFALLGSSNTVTIYVAKKIPIESTLYFITLLSGIASSIVLFLIFFDIGLIFLNIGILIFSLVISELLGNQLYKIYGKSVIIQKILMVIIAISFYHIFGEEYIVLGIALSYFPFLFYVFKTFSNVKINFSLLKKKSNFLISNYAQTLSGAFASSLDKIIIVPLFGFTMLGNYSLGLQFLVLLIILPEIARKYLMAQESNGVVNRKLKFLIIMSSIILAILGIFAGPPVMSYFFPKFIEAQDVIRIVSISVIPTTIMMIYHTKFLGMEQGRHVLITSLSRTISQIILIIILGSIYGINGIAGAFVIASTISAIYAVCANQLLKNHTIK